MSLRSLGLDPMSWLQDPTVEGTETVGGVETDHISAQLDVDALLDDVDKLLARVSDQGLAATGQEVPDRIPADDRAQIEEAVKSATVDVWTRHRGPHAAPADARARRSSRRTTRAARDRSTSS